MTIRQQTDGKNKTEAHLWLTREMYIVLGVSRPFLSKGSPNRRATWWRGRPPLTRTLPLLEGQKRRGLQNLDADQSIVAHGQYLERIPISEASQSVHALDAQDTMGLLGRKRWS